MAKFGTHVSGAVLTAAELNAMGGAWTSYTPTFTGITIGNGTVSGGYVQFGRTTHWRASFTFGTTSAITGAATVTLPPVALRDALQVGVYTAKIFDNGVGWYEARLNSSTTTAVVVEVMNSATTYVNGSALSSTVPMTWVSGDGIYVAGCYEGAT